MIVKSLRGLAYIKKRPKAYQSDGMTVGGNRGFVLASYPSAYPLTSQQRKVKEAARACGIVKGISRRELRDKMVNCMSTKL
jgi:hypothetical protein